MEGRHNLRVKMRRHQATKTVRGCTSKELVTTGKEGWWDGVWKVNM